MFSSPAASKFVDCGRDQAFLLPPDLRDWIPEDDLPPSIQSETPSSSVDMGAFGERRGTGSSICRMMLALLIYCYANG